MVNPIESLVDAGAQSLESVIQAFGGSTVKTTIGDGQPDTPYVIRPSQLEALRRKFIAQYLHEQRLLRQNAKGLRSKIKPELKPLPPAVTGYINSVNS